MARTTDHAAGKIAEQQILLNEFAMVQRQRDDLIAEKNSLLAENSRLSLINTLSARLTELTTPSAVFSFLSEQLCNALDITQCLIYQLAENEDHLLLAAAFGSDLTAIPQTVPVGEGPIGLSAKTQLIQYSEELPSEHSLRWVAIPVLANNQILAVIACQTRLGGTQQDTLQQIAAILAVKLRKLADLAKLETTIAKLEYAELVQKALFNIASLSYDAKHPSDFYQQIHQNVSSLIYAPNFYIALYDDQNEVLHFPYFVDTTEHISPSEVYPKEILANSLTGYVFRSDAPLLIHGDMMADFDREHGVTIYGTSPESWLGVPFKSGDVVSGVVVVQSYDPAFTYSQRELDLLVFVSQHISSALERVFNQQRLVHQALHDALTHLPNRILFMDRLSHAFKRRKRQLERVVAIMYLDLDRFKMVNDTLGHSVGDEFLIEVARILQTCVRQNDTLARLGGDEFAILLEDVETIDDVIAVAERIRFSLQQPVQLRHHRLQTSSSIGIALATLQEPELDQSELIRRADIAMYQAKHDGRGVWREFCPTMEQTTTQHYQLEMEMEAALIQDQFVLHYQPVIDLNQDDTLGFEALIRWPHPEKGFISPGEFIPLAEEVGLLKDIDLYVVKNAIKQAKLWLDERAKPFYISVNISGHSFSEPDFVPSVLTLLQLYQLPSEYLAIEITERALIENMAQAKINISELRNHGIQLFLDDFGTGYSSLNYLHEFKLDVLKIDRSFIAGIKPRVQENPVVNTIITLAKTLQLKVIAEGIETSQQRRLLMELGCDAGQGYWMSRPLPAKEAIEWLL